MGEALDLSRGLQIGFVATGDFASQQTVKHCTQTTGCQGKMKWNPKEGPRTTPLNALFGETPQRGAWVCDYCAKRDWTL